MDDFLETDYENDTLFGNEFSAKDRCQQLGIQIENARKGLGIDRFKYLCLVSFLYLKQQDTDIFDNTALENFFQNVIPKLNNIEYKNPLLCVIVSYLVLEFYPTMKCELSIPKFEYFQNHIYPKNELFFKKNGVYVSDTIRYIRYFLNIFQ